MIELIEQHAEQPTQEPIEALREMSQETLELRWHLVYQRFVQIAARCDSVPDKPAGAESSTHSVQGFANRP